MAAPKAPELSLHGHHQVRLVSRDLVNQHHSQHNLLLKLLQRKHKSMV